MSRWLAASCLVLCLALPAYAQSPEEEVRKVNDATLTTAQKRDVAGYSKLLGDDLRWIEGGGNNPAGRSSYYEGAADSEFKAADFSGSV